MFGRPICSASDIGRRGEYPAGSVGCAESSGELKEGHRNRWFIMFTNVQIDFGFIMGALIPTIIAAGAPHNLGLIWRLSLGLGCVPPLSLLHLRIKLKEPEAYARNNFKKNMPYWLALKYYGPRLILVSAIWFIYDCTYSDPCPCSLSPKQRRRLRCVLPSDAIPASIRDGSTGFEACADGPSVLTYPFSIFSTAWLDVIAPGRSLWQNFGWSTVINCFYMPGALVRSVRFTNIASITC